MKSSMNIAFKIRRNIYMEKLAKEMSKAVKKIAVSDKMKKSIGEEYQLYYLKIESFEKMDKKVEFLYDKCFYALKTIVDKASEFAVKEYMENLLENKAKQDGRKKFVQSYGNGYL
jgi:hypothetical protein